jgi:predicted nucleic acid-binding protein
VTFTEIELGILKLIRLGSPTRAGELEGFRDEIIAIFRDRSLPLTVPVALEVARLAEAIRPMVIERTDLIIAATAKVHRLTVLTRNLRHFSPTGVACLDPLLTLPPG